MKSCRSSLSIIKSCCKSEFSIFSKLQEWREWFWVFWTVESITRSVQIIIWTICWSPVSISILLYFKSYRLSRIVTSIPPHTKWYPLIYTRRSCTNIIYRYPVTSIIIPISNSKLLICSIVCSIYLCNDFIAPIISESKEVCHSPFSPIRRRKSITRSLQIIIWTRSRPPISISILLYWEIHSSIKIITAWGTCISYLQSHINPLICTWISWRNWIKINLVSPIIIFSIPIIRTISKPSISKVIICNKHWIWIWGLSSKFYFHVRSPIVEISLTIRQINTIIIWQSQLTTKWTWTHTRRTYFCPISISSRLSNIKTKRAPISKANCLTSSKSCICQSCYWKHSC